MSDTLDMTSALKRAAQDLGQWIGKSGNALVYGGSKTGLMGEIAKSVLDAGGTVTGVETTLFMQDDLQYDGLTELIVTETITERKTEMIRRGDAFIAFPGGNSEPKQGQRSQSARGFCPRSTMRIPQPDIIEHFGNADAVPQLPERCLSRKAGIVRCCLR